MADDKVIYESEFLEGIIVVVIFKEDDNYSLMSEEFKRVGYGFMVPGQRFVIIDGEAMNNQTLLKLVEAHEISHIMLKHEGDDRDPIQEIEADLGAYLLLKKYGYTESIELLMKNFQFRHNKPFDNLLLEEISKKMEISL
jgi:hypothetical protein